MSFTQKKKTNILHCNGCKKHCDLDYTLDEDGDYYFPMIGGAVINSFQDENDNIRSAFISKQSLLNKGIDQRVFMLDIARKIARLCDNYKQR